MSCETYQQAISLIESSKNILVTTHTRPDGDACGCVSALAEVLRGLGKTVRPLMLSPMPDWYASLFEEKVPVLGDNVQVEDLSSGRFGPIDLVIIVDTNSYSQLPRFEDYLKQSTKPVLVLDHHVAADKLGRVEIADQSAAAAGLVLLDFLKYAGWPIPKRAAEGLFVAIATDTGWFHLRNTDSRVFRRCADLTEMGVDSNDLYRKLYQSFSHPRFELMVAMLNTVELRFDGRYASQYLRREDFERTGAAYRDTENLINECQRIGSVSVSAGLFVELKDGRIRCSLRSRDTIDVNEIARKFGGGGHKLASGTDLPAPLEHAMQLIHDEVAKRLTGAMGVHGTPGISVEAKRGMFKQRVKVSNLRKPELSFEEDFWVDTGALYSFIPEDYLERIEVEPSATRNLILADRGREARLLGFCNFQIEGLEGGIPCPVVFAPKGSLVLLGATALENFGVEVDPIHKTLKPILAVIGGFLASSPAPRR